MLDYRNALFPLPPIDRSQTAGEALRGNPKWVIAALHRMIFWGAETRSVGSPGFLKLRDEEGVIVADGARPAVGG